MGPYPHPELYQFVLQLVFLASGKAGRASYVPVCHLHHCPGRRTQLDNAVAFDVSKAALIGAPEVILPGAFVLAARAKAEQQNSTLQYIMCWLFVALTLFTLASLFVLKLDTTALNILMCARCAAGVCFSILQRVVNHVSPVSPSVSPATPTLDYGEIARQLQPLLAEVMHPAGPVEIDYETLIQAVVSRLVPPETRIVELSGDEHLLEAPNENDSIERRIQALLDDDPTLSHREIPAARPQRRIVGKRSYRNSRRFT